MRNTELVSQPIANPYLRALHFEIRPRLRKHLLIGLALRISIPLIGLISILLFVLFQNANLAILNPFVVFACILISVRTYRLSSRFLVNSKEKLRKDLRPPVLYLRSFFDDYKEISERLDKKTPEEMLAPILDMVGPVIAVGLPQDKDLPLLGAVRVYPTTEWQRAVASLISHCPLIVLHAGTSPGVEWELEAARRALTPEKLIITFLIWQSQNRGATLDESSDWSYERFASRFAEVFGRELPSYTPNMSFIYFEKDWQPYTIELTPEVNPLHRAISFFSESTPVIPSAKIANAILAVLKTRGLINPSQSTKPRPYFPWLFFSSQGRLSRKSFWLKGILPVAVLLVGINYLARDAGGPPYFVLEWMNIFVTLFLFPMTVKRVHDFDMSGWLSLLLIPLCCLGAVVLGLPKGNDEPNRFGSRGF